MILVLIWGPLIIIFIRAIWSSLIIIFIRTIQILIMMRLIMIYKGMLLDLGSSCLIMINSRIFSG